MNCGAVVAEADRERAVRPRARQLHRRRPHRTKGYFERADGGTLFLDEITEMPLELQVKLLRVLEIGRVRCASAANDPITVDVRVIAAHQPRSRARRSRSGKLREDLLLSPATSSRSTCRRCASAATTSSCSPQHFLDELNARRGDAEALRPRRRSSALREHRWPGNVRELKNVVHSAFILADRGDRRVGVPAPPSRSQRQDAVSASAAAATDRRCRSAARSPTPSSA